MQHLRWLAWLVFLSPVVASDPARDLTPEELIQRSAERESEFRKVWEHYTYTQRILFQVLSWDGEPREQQELVVEVYFTNDGQRHTRVISQRGGLLSIAVSPEDISDAVSLQPFVLTLEELPKYQVKYRGKERVDELDTYVFDVKPRRVDRRERRFKGRIWIDDADFQIVMTRGKIEPDLPNNKFPRFETLREQIDGRYWFPTWTEADDVLTFGDPGGRFRRVRVRQLITYGNYRKFEVDASIRFEEPTPPPGDGKP
jgi:hypothetical protein